MLQIINASALEFANYVKKNDSRLYLWGAGVMSQICLKEILAEYDLFCRVVNCTESDTKKIGKYLLLGREKVPIIDVEKMVKMVAEDEKAIIVVACSYYYDILEKMNKIESLNKKKCILLPMLFLENPVKSEKINHKVRKCQIPKKIHYCWFGKTLLSEKNLKCIASWKEYCPEYELIRWDESNINMEESPWVMQAYRNKQWAFVSDYVRAKVLYMYGGFYFDTDVELVRGIDDLTSLEAFGCFEKWPVINTGGGCGSIPRFWLWKEIMELKDAAINTDTDLVIPNASGYFDTFPLMQRGLKANGKTQNIDGFVALTSDYFHPIDYVSKRMNLTDNTYGIHYFNWSWADATMMVGNPREENYYEYFLKKAKKIEKL